METRRFQAPALYGDHHVSEVRSILFRIPGVSDAYASSAFQLIEVSFDPEKVSGEQIEARLREAGYLDELPVLTEPESTSLRAAGDGSFRHTAVYESLKTTISFAHQVESGGRPLWPCPGLDSRK
jgi:copper chaperone CopZ